MADKRIPYQQGAKSPADRVKEGLPFYSLCIEPYQQPEPVDRSKNKGV